MAVSIARIHRSLHAILAERLVIDLRKAAAPSSAGARGLRTIDNGGLSGIVSRAIQGNFQERDGAEGALRDPDRDS